MTVWRAASAATARAQSAGPAKSETITTRLRGRASRPTRTSASSSGSPCDAVGRDALRQRPAQSHARAAAAARRQQPGRRPAEGQQPHAAAAAHRDRAQHVDHALGHVALEPIRGAEGHRRRHVHRQPRREQPLGHLLAHVRDARARGRRRVDLAHVVAGLIGPQLRELGAAADARAAMLAGAHAPDAAHEGEVERLHQRARAPGPGPWRPGRRAAARRSRRQRLLLGRRAGRARAPPP